MTEAILSTLRPVAAGKQIFAEPPDSALVFGHAGSDGTIAIAVPERRVVVVYFTQTRHTPTSQRMLQLCGGVLHGS